MISFEALLVLGAYAFYLYDSGMLLHANELVFINRNGEWGFACPGRTYLLLGRSPYLPNPFTPQHALIRTYWTETGRYGDPEPGSVEPLLVALAGVRPAVVVLLLLFLAGLPWVLLRYGSGPQLLWLFGAVYLNIAVILTQVYRGRKALGLSGHVYLALSFHVLICAPFALNTLRKLSLQRTRIGDPLEFAERYLQPDVRHAFRTALCRQIEQQQELLDRNEPRYTALAAYKTEIETMGSGGI